MSFLNSVLSSLNDGSSAVSVPQVRPAKPPVAGTDGASQPAKRKAEDDLTTSTSKATKLAASKPSTGTARPTLAPVSRTKVPERPKPAQPRNDVSKRPEQAPTHQKTSLQSQPKSATSKAPEQALNALKPQPKKGSFAEILARASQNQTKDAAPAAIGTIKHKPKEKLSLKKELAMQKEALKNGKKGAGGRGPPNAQNGKAGNASTGKIASNVKAANGDPKRAGYQGTMNKPLKPQSSYQGTATSKAKPSVTYSGTMKPGSQPQRKKGYDSEPDRPTMKSSSGAPRRRYHSEEDSEEDQSDDGYDYASEDYSDMDAGFDDVEEEDEEAARIARREDIQEQRMLEELKRKKEEKKRRAGA